MRTASCDVAVAIVRGDCLVPFSAQSILIPLILVGPVSPRAASPDWAHSALQPHRGGLAGEGGPHVSPHVGGCGRQLLSCLPAFLLSQTSAHRGLRSARRTRPQEVVRSSRNDASETPPFRALARSTRLAFACRLTPACATVCPQICPQECAVQDGEAPRPRDAAEG